MCRREAPACRYKCTDPALKCNASSAASKRSALSWHYAKWRTSFSELDRTLFIYLFRYTKEVDPVRAIRAVAGVTQRELAEAAGTSQPTVAAYESDAKSPNWRTVERMAGSVGLACYPLVSTPMTRDQERSMFLHTAIAKELRARGAEVVEVARRNISRMRSMNPHASPLLDEWERILEGTTDQIVARMLDPGEHGRDLRQVTPFAGVLTPAQRAAVYRSFRAG